MMIRTSGLFVAMVCTVAGCAAQVDGSPGSLTLDESTSTLASGRFTKAGASIDFKVQKPTLDRVTFVWQTEGKSLVEATALADGSSITSLLDGRLVVHASPGAEPTFVGDRSAEMDLSNRLEVDAMVDLPQALAAAGVDPSLLVPLASRVGVGVGGATADTKDPCAALLAGATVGAPGEQVGGGSAEADARRHGVDLPACCYLPYPCPGVK